MRGLSSEKWCLVLGASSGHGAATAIHLARARMNVFGVHFDLRSTMPRTNEVIAQIEELGVVARFENANAANDKERFRLIREISAELNGNRLAVFLHSIAFGSLRPFVPEDKTKGATKTQLEMTLNTMAHSFLYWTRDLVYAGLLGQKSQVFAMTSAGSHRILPSYAPVGAAKALLEYYVKQLAVELAPRGVAVNAIQAGITDTPALRKIPDSSRLIEATTTGNPGGRMTDVSDVGTAIAALASSAGPWLTGNVIRIDGGEDLL